MNIYSITIAGSQKRVLVLMVLLTLISVSTAVAQTTSKYEKRGTRRLRPKSGVAKWSTFQDTN